MGRPRKTPDEKPYLPATATLQDVIEAVNLIDKRVTVTESVGEQTLTALKGIQDFMAVASKTNQETTQVLAQLKNDIKDNSDIVQGLTSTLTTTEKAMASMALTAEATTRVLTDHQNRFESGDKDEQMKVMVIEGLIETPNEQLEDELKKLFNDTKMNWGIEQIDFAERVGQRPIQNVNKQDGGAQTRQPRPRSIRVFFYDKSYKKELMQGLKHLKNKTHWAHVSVGDQLTELERRQFLDLRSMFFQARNLGLNAKLRQRAVIVEGKSFGHSMLNNMPFAGLTMENATTAQAVDGIMFRSIHHRLSNLYPVKLVDGDVEYSSVEQAFQHNKAIICADKKAADRIMSLSCPYQIMAEGKGIKTNPVWVKQAEPTLHRLNTIKFQSQYFQSYLLATKSQHLYEASFNPVWGCGYHLGQRHLCKIDSIKGGNLHGIILERIRKCIVKQKADDEGGEDDDDDDNDVNDDDDDDGQKTDQDKPEEKAETPTDPPAPGPDPAPVPGP